MNMWQSMHNRTVLVEVPIPTYFELGYVLSIMVKMTLVEKDTGHMGRKSP